MSPRSTTREKRTARHRPRRGFTLVELIATMLLLSAVLGVIGGVLVQANQRGRAVERRRIALQVANNVLEEVTGRPWDEIAFPTGEAADFPPDVTAGLPGATLVVEVSPNESGETKRVVVEVRWREASHEPRPARLVTWVHREGRDR